MSGREILICVNQGVVLERQAAAVEDAGRCCLREMTSQPKETVLPMVQVGALCCRNQQEAASSTTAGSAGGGQVTNGQERPNGSRGPLGGCRFCS